MTWNINCKQCKAWLGSYDWEWAPDGFFNATWFCTVCKIVTTDDEKFD